MSGVGWLALGRLGLETRLLLSSTMGLFYGIERKGKKERKIKHKTKQNFGCNTPTFKREMEMKSSHLSEPGLCACLGHEDGGGL